MVYDFFSIWSDFILSKIITVLVDKNYDLVPQI